MGLYEKYGVFKCLGCKHYLSGDHFGCEKNCPRTENGVEQIQCRIQDIDAELKRLEKQKNDLLKQKTELIAIGSQRGAQK